MTPAALTARIRSGVPLAGLLGIEVLEASAEAALLRLPPSAAALRPGGTASGPALMTLADVAAWVPQLVADGGADATRTATQTIAFLRPAGAGAVLAEARLTRRGRRMTHAEVWLRAEGEARPCAHATALWATTLG